MKTADLNEGDHVSDSFAGGISGSVLGVGMECVWIEWGNGMMVSYSRAEEYDWLELIDRNAKKTEPLPLPG